MKQIDLSHIAKENHDYAVHLATHHKILTYDNGLFSLDQLPRYTPFETVDFWRDLSLSIEVLLKASLLKHHIPFFKKRAHCEYGNRVCAASNPWLEETLKNLQIEYVAQINTGTISTALKSTEEELFGNTAFDPKKEKLISEMIYIIIRTRRNRNSHFFFPNQASIDMAEIEMLYLPLLNILEELYNI